MNLYIDNFDFDFFKSFYTRFKRTKKKNIVFNLLKKRKSLFQVWSYEDSFLFNTYSWHDYINFYSDLKNIKSVKVAFLHYLKNGYHENRIIIKKMYYNSNFIDWKSFDWKFYIDYHNDLKINNENYAKNHYQKKGVYENRLYSYEHSYFYYNYDWEQVKKKNSHFCNFSVKNIVEYYFKYNDIYEFKELNLKKIIDIDSFHWKFYIDFYDDLNYINDYKNALYHFQKNGLKEDRFFSIFHNYLYLNYDWEKYNLDYQLNKNKKESFIYYLNYGINENHLIYKIYNENTFYHSFFIYFNSINSNSLSDSIDIYLNNKMNKQYLYSYQHYLIFILFDWSKIFKQYKNNEECSKINNSNNYLMFYLKNYTHLNHRLILNNYSNINFLLENKNNYLFLNDVSLLKDIIKKNFKYNTIYFLYQLNNILNEIKNKLFLNIDLLNSPSKFIFNLKESQQEDITFSFIISCDSDEKIIYNILLSIIYQNYKNWRIYFINNNFSSKTQDIFFKIIKEYAVENKINYINNKISLKNINNAFNVYQEINNNDIIIKLNNDWLSSSDVLNTLYDIYKNNPCKIIFSSHKLYFNNQINDINKINEYPQEIQKNISFRSYPDFNFQYFYVGYAYYFKHIPKEYLTYENEWIDSHMAEIFSLVELANGQIYFVDEPLFIYNQSKDFQKKNNVGQMYNFNDKKIIDYIKKLNILQKI